MFCVATNFLDIHENTAESYLSNTPMACLLTCNRSDHESEWVGFGVDWIQSQDLESEFVVYLCFRNRSRNHCQSHSCVYLEQESESVAVNLLVYPFIYCVFKN